MFVTVLISHYRLDRTGQKQCSNTISELERKQNRKCIQSRTANYSKLRIIHITPHPQQADNSLIKQTPHRQYNKSFFFFSFYCILKSLLLNPEKRLGLFQMKRTQFIYILQNNVFSMTQFNLISTMINKLKVMLPNTHIMGSNYEIIITTASNHMSHLTLQGSVMCI